MKIESEADTEILNLPDMKHLVLYVCPKCGHYEHREYK
jgi:hypothetical protein